MRALHAVLTQGSPINVRVFQKREEAAQWLGVPIERLAAEAADPEPNSYERTDKE
jgi:hypothetical protein